VHFHRPIRLMHPRYQLYVVPKPDNRFIIGATQIESEDRSPVSLQSSLELSSALYTLSPAFAEARIIEMDSNLRPAFHDNLPRIDIQNGIIRANGLFRHGYLLAPAVVDSIMASLMKSEETIFFNLLKHS
jgi:glycine oxidase